MAIAKIKIILDTSYNKLALKQNKLFEELKRNLTKEQLKKVKKYIDIDRKINNMLKTK